MEYRHLRFFLAVAEELHFTRASARLGVAQPHVSQEVRRLEEELGVELFRRTRRRVELTPAGEAFREKALVVMAATAEAREAARRAARGETGRLVVAFAGSAGYDVFPDAVRRFRGRWPDVGLHLVEMTTVAMIRALQERTIDVALGRPRDGTHPSVQIEVLRREASVVAFPTGHPLSQRRDIALADLADEEWIVFERSAGPGLYHLLMRACEEAGFRARVVQEAGEIPTMINLVAGGMGLALVPESVTRLSRAGIVYRPLANGAPESALGLMWRKGNDDPKTINFIETLRSTAHHQSHHL